MLEVSWMIDEDQPPVIAPDNSFVHKVSSGLQPDRYKLLVKLVQSGL